MGHEVPLGSRCYPLVEQESGGFLAATLWWSRRVVNFSLLPSGGAGDLSSAAASCRQTGQKVSPGVSTTICVLIYIGLNSGVTMLNS